MASSEQGADPNAGLPVITNERELLMHQLDLAKAAIHRAAADKAVLAFFANGELHLYPLGKLVDASETMALLLSAVMQFITPARNKLIYESVEKTKEARAIQERVDSLKKPQPEQQPGVAS